jgi:hypothetical protein
MASGFWQVGWNNVGGQKIEPKESYFKKPSGVGTNRKSVTEF